MTVTLDLAYHHLFGCFLGSWNRFSSTLPLENCMDIGRVRTASIRPRILRPKIVSTLAHAISSGDVRTSRPSPGYRKTIILRLHASSISQRRGRVSIRRSHRGHGTLLSAQWVRALAIPSLDPLAFDRAISGCSVISFLAAACRV